MFKLSVFKYKKSQVKDNPRIKTLSLNEIVRVFNEAIENYEVLCKINPAGKLGKKRLQRFKNLLLEINSRKIPAEDAFIKICDFYFFHSINSRLNEEIEKKIWEMIGVNFCKDNKIHYIKACVIQIKNNQREKMKRNHFLINEKPEKISFIRLMHACRDAIEYFEFSEKLYLLNKKDREILEKFKKLVSELCSLKKAKQTFIGKGSNEIHETKYSAEEAFIIIGEFYLCQPSLSYVNNVIEEKIWKILDVVPLANEDRKFYIKTLLAEIKMDRGYEGKNDMEMTDFDDSHNHLRRLK